MSSGLLQQLGARGIQDIHLNLKPEVSYWKRGYKRPSAFAEEAIDQSIPNFTWGSERQQQINRNGDLLDSMYLALSVNLCKLAVPGSDTVNWTDAMGHAAIQSAQAYIGNNIVDSTDSDILEVLHELSSDANKNTDELVLRSNLLAQLVAWTSKGNSIDTNDGSAVTQVYTKLPFWFGDADSQALPVVSLQYHDLIIKLRLRTKAQLLQFSNPANVALDPLNNGDIKNAYLMCGFVFLDALERKLFAANAHEYLIKNYQTNDYHVKTTGLSRLQGQVIMSQPVTWFCMFVRKQVNVDSNNYYNFERTTGLADDTIQSMTISFNGAQREKPRDALFFRVIQAERFFNRTPTRPIYPYSFARHPLAWYPSGSVNLSRIDVTSIDFTFPTTDANGAAYGQANVKIIACNFNILRMSGGMAAVKFAS